MHVNYNITVNYPGGSKADFPLVLPGWDEFYGLADLYPMPDVPKTAIDSKGEAVANPNDKAYLAARRQAATRTQMARLVRGLELSGYLDNPGEDLSDIEERVNRFKADHDWLTVNSLLESLNKLIQETEVEIDLLAESFQPAGDDRIEASGSQGVDDYAMASVDGDRTESMGSL